MFLKSKIRRKTKARGCANGRPWQRCISKEEFNSHTVSISALMILCVIDDIEERKVITCDISGAFLGIDWSEDIDCHLKFEGARVDMIYDIDFKYDENVLTNETTRKRKLYTKLTKDVYGTLLGVMLF